MKVREAMARTISTARPSETLDAVADRMRTEDCGFIPVVDGPSLVGVVTDRDIVVRCLAGGQVDPRSETVDHVMSPSTWTIDADATIEAAAHEMAEHEVRRLPVLEGNTLVGVISYGNLEQALHAEGVAASEATLGITRGA